jgi:hypothetical protein
MHFVEQELWRSFRVACHGKGLRCVEMWFALGFGLGIPVQRGAVIAVSTVSPVSHAHQNAQVCCLSLGQAVCVRLQKMHQQMHQTDWHIRYAGAQHRCMP